MWEKWPKKEGAYPKGDIGTDRLQKITDRLQSLLVYYKRLLKVSTTMFTDRLQKITKIRLRLQGLLIDYKRPQYTTKVRLRLQSLLRDYKSLTWITKA